MCSTPPSLDAWLAEVKAEAGAGGAGMYLLHNGVVRDYTRAGQSVAGMALSVDRVRLEEVLAAAHAMPGITSVRAWVNEGELAVGDDIMRVLVGGNIRENVFAALKELVRMIKTEVVTEAESFT